MPDYKLLIDDEIWAFIDRTNACYPTDTASSSIAQQRQIYDAMCRKFKVPYPENVNMQEVLDGGLRMMKFSKGQCNTSILYFHGGGFVVGGLDSHDDICAEICKKTGFDVLLVEYRLSPENPHPAALGDAMQALDFVLDTGLDKIILMGDSAGGNLAAALARAIPDPRVIGQVLIYPGLGGNIDVGSYLEHAKAPMLTRDDVIFYSQIRGGDLDDPTVSPLRAGDFSGLPPSVVFSAQCDPLCDDGVAYCALMNASGGKARSIVCEGLVHGHLRARHMSVRAAECFEKICEAAKEFGVGN